MELRLTCDECGKGFPIDDLIYRCPRDDYPLEVAYDYDELATTLDRETFKKRAWNMWRYRELLPIEDESSIITLGEGGTVLLKSKRLAASLGLRNLYLKDETRNPTWSFKDRGSSVGVTKGMEIGSNGVGCVSTGNMAASLATYAALAGLRTLVLIRTAVPSEKIVHMLICGAGVVAVDRPYPELYQIGLELAEQFRIYWVHSDAPMRVEGQKTSSIEICEQLGWVVPDKIIAPTSSGGNMSALWKGWTDLFRTKLIDEKPAMVAIQNAAVAPIYSAYKLGKSVVDPVIEKPTIAKSIDNPNPPSGLRALRALQQSKGLAEVVNDDEMINAQRLLARTEGIFAEPGAAAAIAGLVKLVDQGLIERDELVVAEITGAGLKDVKSASRIAGQPKEAASKEELLHILSSFLRS